jgi:predicted amidohydrolase
MASTKQPVLGGRESVKVAIAQVSATYMDRQSSTERAIRAITDASDGGAELIVFPEVWLAGYPYWTEGWDSQQSEWVKARVRFADAAVPVPSEETEALAAAAREASAYVVMGCNEMDSHPGVQTIYNSLLFFSPDGALMGKHRKLMPTFTERMYWGMGDARDLVVFDTEIGRLGGLICGEHLMTLVRAAMIAQGEHIHVAVFPGSFALHTGPRLEEPDTEGHFWGHASARAHALEAGAFVLSACGYIDEEDIGEDFPYKNKMNTSYAHGGSSIISPLGVPLVEPTYGAEIIYADLEAVVIKATKAIIDTAGHYARPDVLRLMLRSDSGWVDAGNRESEPPATISIQRDALRRTAELYDIDEAVVESIAQHLGVIAP